MAEDIRDIIREELAFAFRDLAKEASREDSYDTGELESAGLQAVAKVAESLAISIGSRVGVTCDKCGRVAPDHWWKCSRATEGQ